jgi:hypothetical protein
MRHHERIQHLHRGWGSPLQPMLLFGWVRPTLEVRTGPGRGTIGAPALETTPVTPGLLVANGIWDETGAAVVRVPQAG